MKKLLLILFFAAYSFSIKAGSDPQYPVKDIPEALLKNAHIVYRVDYGYFKIEAIDKATYKIRQVITILDKAGDDHAFMATSYDKLRKVTEFSAVIYDKDGKEIDKLKKSEIYDHSYIDGGTLYDDSRIMSADLSQKEYPYTVAYDIELSFKYLYTIPDWVVQTAENASVQYSEFKISSPIELAPRYKQINFDTPPEKKVSGTHETLTWVFRNKPVVKFEPLSKGYHDVSPIIRVAPSKFKYDDYEGSMETWDAMANWQKSLNEGRNNLSSQTKYQMKQLVADKTSITEKIKTIYEYMQGKTRYVSIQLGIGGFQPFEASVVDEMGYGDCKALSFYTKSLLEAVGIKAYYTWIYGGFTAPEVDPTFPDDTFNHIILCVPVEQDTIWLECTNQNNPMGYLGTFTGDRDVLVVNDDGGKIVHTPAYNTKKNNAIITQAQVDFDPEGNAQTKIHTLFKGQGYEYKGIDYYINGTEKVQRDWLNKYIEITNYQINNYAFNETKGMIPEITLDLDLSVRNLASASSKRIFFAPNMLHGKSYIPPKDEDRKTPIYINSTQFFEDSITFKLPENFHIEYLPEAAEVNSEFGMLKVEYIKNDDSILFKREFKLNKGKYSPEKYDELVTFFKEVSKLDKKKVVLTKST